jgi:hypothetical protein
MMDHRRHAHPNPFAIACPIVGVPENQSSAPRYRARHVRVARMLPSPATAGWELRP